MKSMDKFAKSWKSPEERSDMKKTGSMKMQKAGNDKEKAVAKKVAKAAPPNTTSMKGKNSPDSKGASAEGWTKDMKKPKGGGK